MKYSKSALGLLNSLYRSVLKKCLLINLGLFALAAPAMATEITTTGGTDSLGEAFASQPTVNVTGLAISDTTGLQDALDGKANVNLDNLTNTGKENVRVIVRNVIANKVGKAGTTTEDPTGLFKDVADIQDILGDDTDGLVKDVADNKAAIATLTGEGDGSVAKAISDAIGGLDADVKQDAGTDGLSLRVIEENGVITSISGAIAEGTYDVDGAAEQALNDAKAYTDEKLTDGSVSAKFSSIQATEVKVGEGTTAVKLSQEADGLHINADLNTANHSIVTTSGDITSTSGNISTANGTVSGKTLQGTTLEIGGANAISGSSGTLDMNGNSLANISDIDATALKTDDDSKTATLGHDGYETDVIGEEILVRANDEVTVSAGDNYIYVDTDDGIGIVGDTSIDGNVDISGSLTIGEDSVLQTTEVDGHKVLQVSVAGDETALYVTTMVRTTDSFTVEDEDGNERFVADDEGIEVYNADEDTVFAVDSEKGAFMAAADKFMVDEFGAISAVGGKFVATDEGIGLFANPEDTDNTFSVAADDGSIFAASGNFQVDDSGDITSKGTLSVSDGKFEVDENGAFRAADEKFFVDSDGAMSASDGNFSADVDGNIYAAGDADIDGNLSVGDKFSVKADDGSFSAAGGYFEVNEQGSISAADKKFVVNKDGNITKAGTISAANGTFLVKEGGAVSAAAGKFEIKEGGTVSAAAGKFEVKDGGTVSAAAGKFEVKDGGTVSAAAGKFEIKEGGEISAAAGKFEVTEGGEVSAAGGNFLIADDGSFAAANEKFIVNEDGEFEAVDGKFVATDEGIALFANPDDEDSVFSVASDDGSIYAAAGNFQVDGDGDITTKGTLSVADGKFEVDSDGAFRAADEKFIVDSDGAMSAADGNFIVEADGDTFAQSLAFNGNPEVYVDKIDQGENAIVDGEVTDGRKQTMATVATVAKTIGDLTALTEDQIGVTSTDDVASAISSLATNVEAATGGEFYDGSKWKATVDNSEENFNGYEYTESENIMDAINQVAANIGTAEQLSNTFNGVDVDNSVNSNISALNGTMGNITKLNTALKNLTNGGDTAPETFVEAFNNLDATLGHIHTLEGANGNLSADENKTVESHFVSLDNAIGDRRSMASANAEINEATKESVVAGLTAAGNAIGNMDFSTAHYYNASGADANLSDAVKTLDNNIYRIDNDLRDLRHDFYRGMASMAAMSALVPNARSQGNTSLSLGTGAYNGHTAMALGGFHYLTDNLLLNVGASWADSRDTSYRLGVTYSF